MKFIEIKGARANNLKNIDVKIPQRQTSRPPSRRSTPS